MSTRAIRFATPDDAAAILDLYRPFVTESAISFELEPPDAAQIASRIEKMLVARPWLVLEDAGQLLGYAYASPHRDRAAYQWSTEVSVYVHAHARKNGVASSLYQTLFRLLAEQGFYNVYAGITLPNDPSVAFHTAAGFTPVGVYRSIGFKQGNWHDVAWFERALRPYDPPTAPPQALSAPAMRARCLELLARSRTI